MLPNGDTVVLEITPESSNIILKILHFFQIATAPFRQKQEFRPEQRLGVPSINTLQKI